ncbi:hypothetical protein GWI33_014899 [Rhynchophorus ferrugineus]|uniref:Uncharacterized protein n=1 Tax=Rhynchophorus ferrugineus TaxID=354439 RepID=A0A834I6I7_RHYFE|nr:hypothetical protein GWI33_014899 [Rhynchophorus ferrugineus]
MEADEFQVGTLAFVCAYVCVTERRIPISDGEDGVGNGSSFIHHHQDEGRGKPDVRGGRRVLRNVTVRPFESKA